ncbi:hypothetical protein M758_7G156700 [Ceratodon purpureus]|nr:hypothetical protein M758_7G156700 [Ceratodon purpureus]
MLGHLSIYQLLCFFKVEAGILNEIMYRLDCTVLSILSHLSHNGREITIPLIKPTFYLNYFIYLTQAYISCKMLYQIRSLIALYQ